MMQSLTSVTAPTSEATLDKIHHMFDRIDPWKDATWPRNKDLAALYYDLWFENPNHVSSEQWEREYNYHWNQYLEGNDKYVPF